MKKRKAVPSEISIQIFTGGFLSEAVSYEAVKQKLERVLQHLPVKKVIMGWSPDNSKYLYEKTAALLARYDAEFYLWFPVFSETGLLKNLSPLIDLQGRKIESGTGNSEEDFSFCCPNHPGNIEKILDIFEERFAALPFDGVFLDKIRYPSFANCKADGSGQGFENVMSCFCPHCLEKYSQEQFSIEDLKKALSRSASAPLGIRAYKGKGLYSFEDPAIFQFFELKASFIFKSLLKICQYFWERNYRIGFDVFAPFLSAFVGQDLITLSALCDFMKPMMYRITHAPAGIPFETEALLNETVGTDTEKRENFDRIVGVNSHIFPFDLSFSVRELSGLAERTSCDIYAGIEINRKEHIADVHPEYIEDTVKAYMGSGLHGLGLSWNLLDAQEDNLEKVISTYKACQLKPGIF
jgi:hypothetical protein